MKRIVIVGGGFFGCYLAIHLQKKGYAVTLLEAEDDLMMRASYANQARVHGGYHYPRSILTALRSRESLSRFSKEFAPCIYDRFDNYYMLSKRQSHVTRKQFEVFCRRIGAPCEPASKKIESLVNKSFIDGVFVTQEYCFDSDMIKLKLKTLLEEVGVEVFTSASYVGLDYSGPNNFDIRYMINGNECVVKSCHHIFNCTYSNINMVNSVSGLPLVPLRHEITEIMLVDVPDILCNEGITIMDGPFFSLMPFPAKNCYSLTHVRYTPHFRWSDSPREKLHTPNQLFTAHPKKSAFNIIKRDTCRYIPALNDVVHRESLWEIKTILPKSDHNDSRPILFNPNHGVEGFHCIMGGKIDNVYDVVEAIDSSNLIG